MKKSLFLLISFLSQWIIASDVADSRYLTHQEQLVASMYPQTFTGAGEFEGILAHDLLSSRLYGDEHKPGGLFLERVLRYADGIQGVGSEFVQSIITETKLKLAGESPNGNIALLFPLRILAAASSASLSKEEIDIFEDIPSSKILFSLYRKLPDGRFAWQGSYEDIERFIADAETPGVGTDFYNLPLSGWRFWPMIGVGKVGLSLLVKTILDKISIFPMPYDSGKLEAHGVSVTPVSFTFHDFLHVVNNPTDYRISHWVFDNRLPEEWQALNVIDHRIRCWGYLKQVYDQAIQNFDSNLRTEYNQMIVTLYLILHELYAFKGEFLDLTTKESFLNATVAFAKEIMRNKLSDTAVPDGTTDDQIIQTVCQAEDVLEAREKIGDNSLTESSVTQNSMGAVVRLKFTSNSDSGLLEREIPTMLSMERELGDYVPLLKICGLLGDIDTTQPLRSQRSLIIGALEQLFDIFLQRALA